MTNKGEHLCNSERSEKRSESARKGGGNEEGGQLKVKGNTRGGGKNRGKRAAGCKYQRGEQHKKGKKKRSAGNTTAGECRHEADSDSG